MTKFILISFTLLGAFVLGARGQECGIEGVNGTTITLAALPEDIAGGEGIARFQLFNVKSSATVSNPHNKYLSAQRYANGVYDVVTTDETKNFVTVERATEIRRTSRFVCLDDSSVQYTFHVPIPDTNNQVPKFSQETYQVVIQLPLVPSGNTSLVTTSISVSDADLEFEFADIHVTSSNRDFAAVVTPKANPSCYEYQVDFLVPASISEGVYSTLLVADDRKHQTTVPVSIVVLHPGTPEPEPVEPTTTTEATPEPTTEEEVVTTTEDPETEAPTTEAEPEPTTEEENETTTTEKGPEPTTEEPVPETCGLVGLDASETVRVLAINPFLAPNTEIWRGNVYNVNYTTAASHPHNKYVLALRSGANYWFTAGAEFSRFIIDQGTNVIQRRVNFYCNGGLVVQYHFELELYDGPIEEPELPEGDDARKMQRRQFHL